MPEQGRTNRLSCFPNRRSSLQPRWNYSLISGEIAAMIAKIRCKCNQKRQLGFWAAEDSRGKTKSKVNPPPRRHKKKLTVAHLSCGEVVRGSVLQVVDLHASRLEGLIGGAERLLTHALRLRRVEAPRIVGRLARPAFGAIVVVPHGHQWEEKTKRGRKEESSSWLVMSLAVPLHPLLRSFGRLSPLALFSEALFENSPEIGVN